jgi:carbon-monoxide dehydrogenase medium subunit
MGLLADHRDRARVIAGGTDLLIELERKVRDVDVLVDITRIQGLDRIWMDENGALHIGPLVTHNQLVASELVVEHAFPLAQAAWSVGAPQIRNRGTLVGNLITASPANDTISPLWALDARVRLVSLHGERVLSFPEFFQGVRHTALADDELLLEVIVPSLPVDARGTFQKLGLRRAQAISVVNVTVVVALDGERVCMVRISQGSVAPTVIRSPEAEVFLIGRPLRTKVIERAATLAGEASRPISDLRAPADYRADMVRVLVKRALIALRDGHHRDTWPDNPPLLWGRTDGRYPTWGGQSGVVHPAGGDQSIEVMINGSPYCVTGANDKTLLHLLRENLGLMGTKEGCGEGECGACTVLMDGVTVFSCLVPAPRAHGTEITTIEGLADGERLHPLQQAFMDQGAVQCGYCTPGFIMTGASLLAENPRPSREQISQAVTGNLCRCTGYRKIIAAFEQARGK